MRLGKVEQLSQIHSNGEIWLNPFDLSFDPIELGALVLKMEGMKQSSLKLKPVDPEPSPPSVFCPFDVPTRGRKNEK
jgi:hypothetical protein